MYQLIGGLLAIFAILSALAGALVAGAVFALLTFIWVVVAKPGHRASAPKDDGAWGDVYEAPFTR